MKKTGLLLLLLAVCIFSVHSQTPSVADELIKLKNLLDKGVITKQEFNDLKKRLISQPANTSKTDSTVVLGATNSQKNNSVQTKENKATFPDPEFSLRPYLLTSENTLKNLERTDAKYDVKIKAFGYGGTEMYFTAFTPKSDSRFKGSSLPVFIIKVDGDNDPSEVVKLVKAEEGRRDSRRFLISRNKMMGGASSVQDKYVSLEYKKLRTGIYQIMLPDKLPAGEYAFVPVNLKESMDVKISCFGVD